MADWALFVDYDGTITNLDTSDVLVRASAGPERWNDLEAALRDGSMSLREVLAEQFAHVRLSLDDADALLAERTVLDPTFAPFVRACEARSCNVTVLSSGLAPLIRRALARAELLRVAVYANEVDADPWGWRLRFRDDSDNGHDKAAAVRAANERGASTIFIGDGHSDFEAALVADRRFAKKGRALETYLRERGVSFTPFERFSQIQGSLFATPGSSGESFSVGRGELG